MKKFSIYLIALFLIPSLLFTGCKKEETPTVDTQKALTTYLVGQGLDINTILSNFVFDTPDNISAVANMYIIDIRTAAEFTSGRIQGAIRCDMKDILTEAAKAGTKQILVVCKSGQTATWATALLRLSGYPTAQALKWGMSRWNAALDVWTPNIANLAQGHAKWNTLAAPANLVYATPKITGITSTIGSEILKARVAAVLAGGFKSVEPAALLANPTEYFVNNYFPNADYIGFGHLEGAFRIQPMLVSDGSVKFMDPARKIATYCYTGQTSGAISAYLNVIGYDAYSTLWGMNKFNNAHTFWTTNKWSASLIKNLPIITG